MRYFCWLDPKGVRFLLIWTHKTETCWTVPKMWAFCWFNPESVSLVSSCFKYWLWLIIWAEIHVLRSLISSPSFKRSRCVFSSFYFTFWCWFHLASDTDVVNFSFHRLCWWRDVMISIILRLRCNSLSSPSSVCWCWCIVVFAKFRVLTLCCSLCPAL